MREVAILLISWVTASAMLHWYLKVMENVRIGYVEKKLGGKDRGCSGCEYGKLTESGTPCPWCLYIKENDDGG